MKDTIFREYDIRGIVGDELIITEVYDLVRAIAYYFMQKSKKIKTVVVGMDGRVHSPIIKREVCRALIDSGIDVFFIGVCPSPVLYFALHRLAVEGGLMITASHNPKEYNGMKICLGMRPVWGKEIQKIVCLYRKKKYIKTADQGNVVDKMVIPDYVDWFVNHFQHLKSMDLSAVIDCGNGTAGTVMPQLIARMGWRNMHLLYSEVDGTFPNHEADPVKEVNMRAVKQQIKRQGAAIGIGFDGDADRVGVMTAEGYLIPGDKLLGIFAQDIVAKNPGMSVVFNVICSSALVELLEQYGIKPIMTKVGHSIIEDTMRERNALLGGEISCHFFFRDRHFGYDDGIYAACRLFEILYLSGKSLSALLALFPHKVTSREFRIPCSEEKKEIVVERAKELLKMQPGVTVITIDGVRAHMKYGWGIVRASNTQPVLSLRFESDSLEGLKRVKQDFIRVLQEQIDIDTIKQHLAL